MLARTFFYFRGCSVNCELYGKRCKNHQTVSVYAICANACPLDMCVPSMSPTEMPISPTESPTCSPSGPHILSYLHSHTNNTNCTSYTGTFDSAPPRIFRRKTNFFIATKSTAYQPTIKTTCKSIKSTANRPAVSPSDLPAHLESCETNDNHSPDRLRNLFAIPLCSRLASP